MQPLTPCLLATCVTMALGCNIRQPTVGTRVTQSPGFTGEKLPGPSFMTTDDLESASLSETQTEGGMVAATFPFDEAGTIYEPNLNLPPGEKNEHTVEAATPEIALDPAMMDEESLQNETERTRHLLANLFERADLNPREHPDLDRALDNPDNLPPADLLRRRYEIMRSIPQHSPSDGWISSTYGKRRIPGDDGQHFHKGIDIAAHTGTLIYAPGDGVVRFSGRYGSYGKFLAIVHGYGIVTKFGHNDKLLVKTGDRVKMGDPIARVGDTGNSRGMHLHYEVWINDRSVDPLGFMPPVPGLSDDPERLVANSGEP